MKILSASCIAILKGYRLCIAPLFMSLGVRCRFEPSCSHYAQEAIEEWGVYRGILMSIFRLARCHPFCEGGHDPVKKCDLKINGNI